MSTRKTIAEKIAETRKAIEQHENQMKLLLQKQKEQDRKDRTRRLIERGAILESLIPSADSLTNEQIKLFLGKTIQTEFARRVLKELAPPPAAHIAAETAQAAPKATRPSQAVTAAIAHTTGHAARKAG